MASKIACSSSGIVIEPRPFLRHHCLFGGGVGVCLISLGPPGSEDSRRSLLHQCFFGGGTGACLISPPTLRLAAKQTALIPVINFAGDFETFFFLAQTMSALKYFAAIKIALPLLSSLVASCKISESNASQGTRIKIQTTIARSLRHRR